MKIILAILLLMLLAPPDLAAATVLQSGYFTWENVSAHSAGNVVVLSNVSKSATLLVIPSSEFSDFASGRRVRGTVYNGSVSSVALTQVAVSAGDYSVIVSADSSGTSVDFAADAFPAGAGRVIAQRSYNYTFTLGNYSTVNITAMSFGQMVANVSGLHSFVFDNGALETTWSVQLDRGAQYILLAPSSPTEAFLYVKTVPALLNPVLLTNFSQAVPVGVASYGLFNASGTLVPYQVSTDAIMANATIREISAYNSIVPANVSASAASLQLNAMLDIATASGDYYYWLQNVMLFNTSGKEYSIVDNVWNSTQPFSNMSAALANGRGKVSSAYARPAGGAPRSVEYYAYSANSSPYGATVSFRPVVRVALRDGFPVVQFGYYSGGSLRVYYNVTIAAPAFRVPPSSARLLVTPFYRTPSTSAQSYPNFFDAEFVFGGGGNNAATTFEKLDADLWIYYDSNGTTVPFPSVYTFGSDTAETAFGLTAVQSGSGARVTTGRLVPSRTITFGGGIPSIATTSTAPEAQTTLPSITSLPTSVPQGVINASAVSGILSNPADVRTLLEAAAALIALWLAYLLYRRLR